MVAPVNLYGFLIDKYSITLFPLVNGIATSNMAYFYRVCDLEKILLVFFSIVIDQRDIADATFV